MKIELDRSFTIGLSYRDIHNSGRQLDSAPGNCGPNLKTGVRQHGIERSPNQIENRVRKLGELIPSIDPGGGKGRFRETLNGSHTNLARLDQRSWV